MLEMSMMMIVFYIVGFFIWVFAFIMTLKSEFKNNTNKIIWIIALLFLPPSALLFPFIGMNQIK